MNDFLYKLGWSMVTVMLGVYIALILFFGGLI